MPTPPTPATGPGRLGTGARVVYLPVNRPFEAAFRSVAAEVTALPEAARAGVTLLVVDDCGPAVSRANREVCNAVVREAGPRVRVLAADGWRRLVNDLLAAADLKDQHRSIAGTALVKPSGSYGAGPNKAALIAALEDAVSLHRRDSDQITATDPGTGASPLRIEAELFDRARAGSGPAPYCVGSSLTGRPTRDRRDLEHGSAAYVERIDALSRLPADPPRPQLPDRPERAALHGGQHAERDYTGTVEMGIAALREVHEWIPEMPAVGILGSDYFQKGLLYQLDLPVYHHARTARHVYEPWRARQSSDAHLEWYARAELRYTVLRRHWNAFNRLLTADPAQVLRDGHFDQAAYAELFVEALHKGTEGVQNIPGEFVAVYREAAAGASGDVRRRLAVRVAALEEEAETAVGYVADAIHEFTGLTRLWPRLVAAARQLGRTNGLAVYTS
ncbi:DUF6271 family protein [Streptomyces axinellae]|uniref:Uncharacterized protein n=1 Tax=Streptomyces axinellae TaxID=552788 RepID=A0ABP6DBA0_9ACTN